jgi:hypothetical protein
MNPARNGRFEEIPFSKGRSPSYKTSRNAPIPDLLPGSHYWTTGNANDAACLSKASVSRTFPLLKGMIMANNSKSGNQGGSREQHAEAGRQSHKNDANKQSGSGSGSRSGGSGGTRGGTPEQHAEAGRQSHKNDGNKQSASGSGSRSGGSRGSNR